MGLYALVLLLFPNGRLLSSRWRFFVGVTIGAVVLAVPGQAFSGDNPDNPYVIDSPVLGAAFQIGIVLLLLCTLAAVGSLLIRFRRAGGIERQQLKLLLFAASIVLVMGAIAIPYYYSSVLIQLGIALALVLLPVSIGVAILRYRLYDIDVVINKTLVYGALAAFITAIYVGIVVGIGSLIGSGDEPNLGLSVIATALIAVAFQPFKSRVQRLANRMVYGKRSTPYEVLAEFSTKMAGSYAQDELLSQMAATLAEGTAAASAHVWVKIGDQIRLAASFHRTAHADGDDRHHEPISFEEGDLKVPHSDHVVRVTHKGELLGALAITKRAGEAVTPVEEKLMNDLAAQAGVVLRNARLNEELLLRLEELRASRQRLVAAANQARRRLERDLHDGAQQQLVALKVKLSLAQRLTTQDKVKQFLTQLQSEADDALQTLRDLARGIYPPLLAEKGLATALVAQANKFSLEVEVRADGVGRYPQELEAAVYFCCLEALQNVSKYAGSCEVVITLADTGRALTCEVKDTGCGFDAASIRWGTGLQNMSDRVDALGGTLSLESQQGSGTTVAGRIPIQSLEPAHT
jgi:signal transduction histidine kinase